MADTAESAVAEALWNKVQEDFASDKAHEAYLNHCRNADMLSAAAARYTVYKNTLNEDQIDERELVDKRLSAVAILAMSQLDALRSPPPTRGRRILTYVAALVALGSVIGMAALLAL